MYLGEDPKNGFVIATHTPEEKNDYLGNMFVVAVFEQDTTVEVYNHEGIMKNSYTLHVKPDGICSYAVGLQHRSFSQNLNAPV